MRYDLKTCDGPKCTPEAIATDDEGCVLTSTKEQYFCGPDLEIIPGAADHALFDKVVLSLRSSRIKDWKAVSSDFSYLPQLFAGPQARKPREESEVFFSRSAGDAGKNEAAAQVTAKVLEPIIGPVAVKAWPGPWDYHVVVVVGSKAGADKKAE
jgi:hypothetical protein